MELRTNFLRSYQNRTKRGETLISSSKKAYILCMAPNMFILVYRFNVCQIYSLVLCCITCVNNKRVLKEKLMDFILTNFMMRFHFSFFQVNDSLLFIVSSFYTVKIKCLFKTYCTCIIDVKDNFFLYCYNDSLSITKGKLIAVSRIYIVFLHKAYQSGTVQ